MANQWLRLWHDMPTDPKWRTIARVSEQSIALVQAVYVHMLVTASRNVTRGHVDVTTEDLASALDVTEDQIQRVLSAMQGRVLDGDYLTGWEKRQPKKEDSGNTSTEAKTPAQRKREQRQREAMSRDVTTSHDESRDVTTDKDKDKDKEESNTPQTPQGGSPVGFDDFWTLYPRHTAKQNAVKAWAKVPVSLHDVIFAAVKAQSASPSWTKDGGQYIPHAASWINAKRWEDEIAGGSTTVKRNTLEYAKAHAQSTWWAEAGFEDVWNAMGAGCFHDTAHRFSSGRRVE